MWQKPVAQVLAGGLATLPLAVLSDLGKKDPQWVIDALHERLQERSARPVAGEIWAATKILLGLRYPESVITPLLRGVLAMTESVTYQAIVREGQVEQAHRTLLRQGSKRFGKPSATEKALLLAVTDLAALDALTLKVLSASSWHDLLSTAQPGRRQQR